MIKKNKQSGQSLMEAIVAIAILLMVVMAVLALTISGVTGQKENEQQVIANNLAREGIELIRNLRDSNWLAGVAWDTGFSDSGEGIIDYVSASVDYGFSSSQLDLDIDGFYSHQPSGFYSRVVQISSICYSPVSGEIIRQSCDAGEQKIGVKVVSLVSWQDDDNFKEVRLEDLLYDWK